ncbi:MAG TPA: Asp-tRNA(Asn)/Glu-tRNA(Gln) amidotransferase GatCAB subunit B, partial [Candidatus Thermoplasmatota archaeon]|nr:Asp-tRNA(Asn)/Glu-tRNA(Gln) amidotransferase GatCAB subunit B [Candidatus Thermoplasmatota archaeon]
ALARETAQAGPAGDDLDAAVRAAIEANPKAVADYRAGKPAAANFLVGQAMKALRGRADANELRRRVEAALGP